MEMKWTHLLFLAQSSYYVNFNLCLYIPFFHIILHFKITPTIAHSHSFWTLIPARATASHVYYMFGVFCLCRTENMHWINANIHHPSLAYELWCIFLGLYTIYIFPFRLCIYEFAIAIARQPKTVVVRALSSVCRGHLHLHPNTTTHYSIWYMFSQGKRRS